MSLMIIYNIQYGQMCVGALRRVSAALSQRTSRRAIIGMSPPSPTHARRSVSARRFGDAVSGAGKSRLIANARG